MSQECSLESLLCNNTFQLKVKDTLSDIAHKNDLNKISVDHITEQVSALGQKQNIENLSLLGNQLSFLPLNLTELLINLVHLDLSKNQLSDLPTSLNLLKKLVYLNIDCNQFSCIPDVVSELSNLRTFKASRNHLKSVPCELANLINLQDLDLSFNLLTDLPMSYENLHCLRNLSLATNKIKKISFCVANGMRNLQVFDFSQNLNAELNIPPKSIRLTVFRAEKNKMCPSFPKWIISATLPNLTEVSLNDTQFKYIDLSQISKSSIKKISMKQCQLSDTTIEKMMAEMIQLEELIIGNTHTYNNNSFWRNPIESLKQPSCIKRIDLGKTGIPVIPKTVNNFANLLALDLNSNTIDCLPEEICSLKSLRSLLIQNNHLMCLPKLIGELVSLEELNVSHNYLSHLPNTMESLSNLQYLNLYNNEFEAVPEIIKSLPSLIGLDLEQNYFSTVNLSLGRSVQYERIRTDLRNYWYNGDNACNGFKVKTPDTLELIPERSSSSLSNSTEKSFDERDATIFFPEGTYNNNTENERWDTSEDSADEFDPHECKEPKQRNCSPVTHFSPYRRTFCPAELHQTRVITRVMQMLKDGRLVWSTNYEEGQFDDA